jgi:hypothetical protein
MPAPGQTVWRRMFPESGDRCAAGGAEVVQTLGGVIVGETVGALEFEEKDVFDEQVGEVVADPDAFIEDRKGACVTTRSPRRRSS